jgi:hypothetical protein
MIAMARRRSITMAAAVRVVGIVGITTTSGTNKRRMESVGTWSVSVDRRLVSRLGSTDWLWLYDVATGPWCTWKVTGSIRLDWWNWGHRNYGICRSVWDNRRHAGRHIW